MNLNRRRFLTDLAGVAATALIAPHALAGRRDADKARGAYRLRSVGGVVTGTKHSVQGVLGVKRTIPHRRAPKLDPWIMLDHFDQHFEPGYTDGIKAHPHRGFETISLIFEGGIRHRDSLGNLGHIERGDYQWMTAGSGIVHSEFPMGESGEDLRRVQGIQLWLNLPKRLKMRPPMYQDNVAAAVPTLDGPGVTGRVFSGRLHDVRGIVKAHSPVHLADYTLDKGAELTVPLPKSYNAFVHVVSGRVGMFGLKGSLGNAQMAWFERDGEGVHVRAVGGPARFIIGAGEPLNEPVAQSGPFVMNTREECRQAWADYRSGKMGRVTR